MIYLCAVLVLMIIAAVHALSFFKDLANEQGTGTNGLAATGLLALAIAAAAPLYAALLAVDPERGERFGLLGPSLRP